MEPTFIYRTSESGALVLHANRLTPSEFTRDSEDTIIKRMFGVTPTHII